MYLYVLTIYALTDSFILLIFAAKLKLRKMNIKLFTAISALALLASCTENPDLAFQQQETQEKAFVSEQSIIADICNYINSERKVTSKSTSLNLLEPYIYNGDTVMYIANYDEGWDLFSTDHRVPMIIASCNTGNYNESDLSPALSAYLQTFADDIYQVKSSQTAEAATYGLWNSVYIKNEDIDLDEIIVDESAVGTMPSDDGYWTLIDRTSTTSEETSTKLTETLWGQSSPWNAYTPFKSDGVTHSVAGCEAVATSQFLYFTHYNCATPTGTVTDAVYDSDENEYAFSGFSESVWDEMALSKSSSGDTDAVAVFIAYIGQKINTNYTDTTSSAKIKDACTVINELGGFSYEVQDEMDYDDILENLKDGMIVYARATSSSGGHAFLIDRYTIQTTEYTSTYGWVGTDTNGNDTNEYDEEGNIVGYSFTYQSVSSTISKYVYMNWGWDGYQDDVMLTASDAADWEVSSYNYNKLRKYLKQNN